MHTLSPSRRRGGASRPASSARLTSPVLLPGLLGQPHRPGCGGYLALARRNGQRNAASPPAARAPTIATRHPRCRRTGVRTSGARWSSGALGLLVRERSTSGVVRVGSFTVGGAGRRGGTSRNVALTCSDPPPPVTDAGESPDAVTSPPFEVQRVGRGRECCRRWLRLLPACANSPTGWTSSIPTCFRRSCGSWAPPTWCDTRTASGRSPPERAPCSRTRWPGLLRSPSGPTTPSCTGACPGSCAVSRRARISTTTPTRSRCCPGNAAPGGSRRSCHSCPGGAGAVSDVGCGTGHQLELMLTEAPRAYGVGVDIAPTVVELARARLGRAGLLDRSMVLVADVESLPSRIEDLGGPVDLVLLANVLYYWPRTVRVRLLTRRERPGPHRRQLLLITTVTAPDLFTHHFDLLLQAQGRGIGLPTTDELRRHLADSGLRPGPGDHVAPGVPIVAVTAQRAR